MKSIPAAHLYEFYTLACQLMRKTKLVLPQHIFGQRTVQRQVFEVIIQTKGQVDEVKLFKRINRKKELLQTGYQLDVAKRTIAKTSVNWLLEVFAKSGFVPVACLLHKAQDARYGSRSAAFTVMLVAMQLQCYAVASVLVQDVASFVRWFWEPDKSVATDVLVRTAHLFYEGFAPPIDLLQIHDFDDFPERLRARRQLLRLTEVSQFLAVRTP
jgi:hypothetical protein